ncbi:MAG: cyclopropane fatty acyl phospholipid synthase [Holophaga sp.]|nr:cyclopropane fatty acyl phospholipid synthase [Holophaga sp.]
MREAVDQLLSMAGIAADGTKPWDIQVHDPRFYQRAWDQRNLGMGEAYMDGWWDSPRLDEFFARLLRAGVEECLKLTPGLALRAVAHRLFNFQSRRRSWQVAFRHYDLGNELFQAMLDPGMNYSCAYWHGAATLEQAQENKLELVCRKLMLKPGMRLLDIGCGWGSLARHAARNHGVEVVGVTLSAPQQQFAQEACKGLPVTIRLQDYRDLPAETFDRVASIGMFEHVGHKNYRAFLNIVRDRLADDGLFLLHTIGGGRLKAAADPWIQKYIFPNGEVPSLAGISQALEGRFVMEDWHNFGSDYDLTLMAWHRNFTEHWSALQGTFDQRFYRMWSYYLLSCAGAFRARNLQLWQLVLSKHGMSGGFAVRDLMG